MFRRNARFSNLRPVPDLGYDETDIETVKAFYQFWRAFDSWREFSALDEHDVTDAGSREEKRWMERQNESARKRKKKQDRERISTLVSTAWSIDPRIIRERAARKEEAAREKVRKAEAAAAAAAAKLAAEEAAAAAEQARQESEKKAKANQKKALRTARTKLRGLCRRVCFAVAVFR